jgi:glycosyltransferase involved in cell wall biosynthesis
VGGGLSSARNAGIAAAAGELICFLDADDVLLPDKLERQVAFLDQFPCCDLVFSDWYVGDSTLTPLFLWRCEPPRLPMREVLVYGTWFAPMAPLMRARLVERTGPFDESLRGSEDWDFWIRASGCGALSYLPGPVAVYRLHARQMHRDGALMRNSREGVMRKHFKPGTRELEVARAATALREAVSHWERLPLVRALAAHAEEATNARADLSRAARHGAATPSGGSRVAGASRAPRTSSQRSRMRAME